MSQNEDLTNDRSEVYSRPAAHFDGDGALVVRASAASSCRRALWYAATEHQPTNPPSDESLTVMEVGQALEQVVLRAMERASWDVIPVDPNSPREVTAQITPNLRVTGHPDATGVLPFFGGPEVIVEVKTRGPEAYKRWQTLGAERSHPESVAQAALYTYGKYGEARDVVIATMDTGSRQWDTETIPAERVEDAMEAVSFRLGDLADHYAAHGQDPDELPDLPLPEYVPARSSRGKRRNRRVTGHRRKGGERGGGPGGGAGIPGSAGSLEGAGAGETPDAGYPQGVDAPAGYDQSKRRGKGGESGQDPALLGRLPQAERAAGPGYPRRHCDGGRVSVRAGELDAP